MLFDDIPSRSWTLGVLFADEMEIICDQAPDVVAIIAEIGEEPIHRRLEIGEGGEVLIVDGATTVRLTANEPSVGI